MIYLILILGLILRLVSLNQSLWLDEATSALVARMSLQDIFIKFLPGDFHPPLYYLILHFWVNFFGSSELVIRMVSLFAGLGTIWVIYRLGGKIPALFLATSGLHIYYSQEARMYSLVTLLVSYLVYLFVKRKWFLFSVVLALVGMTDYVALFIIPVFWILGFKFWKKLAIYHLPFIISYLLWLPYFLKQLNAGFVVKSQSFGWWQILGQANFKNIILIPTKFIFGRINIDVTAQHMLVVGFAFFVFGYLFFRSLKEFKKLKIAWLWFLAPLTLGIFLSFWIPFLSYFRFLFILPAFYLLISHKISRSLLMILVLFNLITSSIYLLNKENHREDWRRAVHAIGDSPIIFPAESQREAVKYYNRKANIIEKENLSAGFEELWLSRYVWEIFDPNDSVRKKIESLGYNKAREFNFNGVVFYRYEDSN